MLLPDVAVAVRATDNDGAEFAAAAIVGATIIAKPATAIPTFLKQNRTIFLPSKILP